MKLHPSQHVISASTDGLVAVHDMSKGLVDDDDNFTAALNVGTSVEELGLYGDGGERVWVRTGTETLHLWEWRAATLGDREGGDEAFAQWPEARATAAAAAATSTVASLFEEVQGGVGDRVSDEGGSWRRGREECYSSYFANKAGNNTHSAPHSPLIAPHSPTAPHSPLIAGQLLVWLPL